MLRTNGACVARLALNAATGRGELERHAIVGLTSGAGGDARQRPRPAGPERHDRKRVDHADPGEVGSYGGACPRARNLA